jgi:hypothetical protein
MTAKLERRHTLRETLALLESVEEPATSRLRVAPCRFVRAFDVFFHIVLPELLENRLPRAARRMRVKSPRWGRSWRPGE